MMKAIGTRRFLLLGSALLSLLAGPLHADPAPIFPTETQLRALYTLPQSRFMEIDGEPIHYVVEGKGDPIVLMHGSFASLRQWNGWAKALSRRYRVIRFDMPPAGLSGPNPQGDISVARKVHIVGEVTRRLGADRFILVATSSAGVPAAAFAADQPARVRGLVLNNIAVGPVKLDPSHFPEALKQVVAEDKTHPGYHKPEYWRQILLLNIEDQRRVTPELVQEWTDLNNRFLQMKMPPVTSASAGFSRTPDDLSRMTMPTLLLWSANDHEAMLEREGRKAMELLASPDKALVVIPACGHMMPLDCSAAGLKLAMPFIDRIAKTAPR
ncbi:MAG: alpha/beta hydrolase [Sphingobium sp.]